MIRRDYPTVTLNENGEVGTILVAMSSLQSIVCAAVTVELVAIVTLLVV